MATDFSKSTDDQLGTKAEVLQQKNSTGAAVTQTKAGGDAQVSEERILETLANKLSPTSDQFDNAYVKHPNKPDLKIPIRHPMVTAYLVSEFYRVAGVLPTTGQKEMFLIYLEGKAWANRKEVDPSDWAASELEQEPLVGAILALLNQKKEFEGTREMLKAEFKNLLDNKLIDGVTYEELPNTVQKLSITLSKIAPALAQIGIVIERGRTASERKLKIHSKPATSK